MKTEIITLKGIKLTEKMNRLVNEDIYTCMELASDVLYTIDVDAKCSKCGCTYNSHHYHQVEIEKYLKDLELIKSKFNVEERDAEIKCKFNGEGYIIDITDKYYSHDIAGKCSCCKLEEYDGFEGEEENMPF